MISLVVRDNRGATFTVISCLTLATALEAIGISAMFPVLAAMLDMDTQIQDGIIGRTIQIAQSYSVYQTAAFILGCFVLKSIVNHLSYYIIAKHIASFSNKLRISFVDAVVRSKITFIHSKSLGENLSVLTNDSIRSAQAYISAARTVSSGMQVALYVLYALWLSVPATLLSFVTIALLTLLVRGTLSRTREAGHDTTVHMHALSKNMGEAIRGIKAAKASAREEFICKKIKNSSEKLYEAHRTGILVGQTLRNIQDPVLVGSVLFCLISFKVLLQLDPSEIIFILAIYYRLMSSMNTLQADIQKYLGQESALWSILNITRKAEEEKEVHTKGHSITFETPQDIRLKNIGLCFGEKEIFTGLNFTFPKNQITLLKGESGKGKTSVIDIICGLLQPTQGEVKVSGTPLAQIDIYQWRRQIGYVDQFPFLFKGSVRENIVQDGPTFENDEHLNNCLTLSHLDDFVASLEDGLNFMLEEGGNNISGGQRQRIALARALYFRPNYLILDEPTSALDPSSQEMIFNSMTALKKQMTVIAISHSTEIEPYADSVLDMGEISRT